MELTMELYYNVMLQQNSTRDISLRNLQDFVRLFWMAASKVITEDENRFSFGINVTIIDSTDLILI